MAGGGLGLAIVSGVQAAMHGPSAGHGLGVACGLTALTAGWAWLHRREWRR
jgi:hypothetical protein